MMKWELSFTICRGCQRKPSRPQLKWRSALLAVLFGIGFTIPSYALDPLLPPGGNFDLSRWKLTLPLTNAAEIPAAQLAASYSNAAFFYTGADGAMIFWCPVTGGTTSGSSYPRSELRELLVSTDDNVNWPGLGTHTLEAECRVVQIPSSKKVIIGQIHAFGDDANPLVKLQYDDGEVEALIKLSPSSGPDTNYSFMGVALNSPITYRLQLTDGLLAITVNGSNRTINVFQTDPAWAGQTFYFKAGSYCQDNLGPTAEGALVAFHQLNVTHAGAPLILNSGFTPGGQFGFTFVAYTSNAHTIQTSSNLVSWTDVFTNGGFGSFAFADPDPPFGSRRFYRVRQFP